MMTELTINLYPIVKIIGYCGIIGIALFLIHNLGGMKIFSKHDQDLTAQFLEKYPLVSLDFLKKTQKEQLIENNQEIHNINKDNKKFDERLSVLEVNYYDILDKLNQISEEIKKRG